MIRVSDNEFESYIQRAIDSIPERFLDELDNVVFIMEDEPVDDGLWGDEGFDPDLLGLYDGVSLTERADGYGSSSYDYPDSITIFKGPHQRLCFTKKELAEEVRKTVVHEVGHYFGMDENQITEMGYE